MNMTEMQARLEDLGTRAEEYRASGDPESIRGCYDDVEKLLADANELAGDIYRIMDKARIISIQLNAAYHANPTRPWQR